MPFFALALFLHLLKNTNPLTSLSFVEVLKTKTDFRITRFTMAPLKTGSSIVISQRNRPLIIDNCKAKFY